MKCHCDWTKIQTAEHPACRKLPYMQLSEGHTCAFHEQVRANVRSLIELVAVTTCMTELQHVFTKCEHGCTEALVLCCRAEEPTLYLLLSIQLSMASQYTSVSAMLLATALSNQRSTASTSCTLSKTTLAFLNAALVSAPPALHWACKQACTAAARLYKTQ